MTVGTKLQLCTVLYVYKAPALYTHRLALITHFVPALTWLLRGLIE
jgi:hypothetical protein